MIALRTPRPDELSKASELCLRSKAHWGYPEDFMALCTRELTLSPDDLNKTEVILAFQGRAMAGVAQVCMDEGKCFLEKLFVDPEFMGTGAGKLLFAWSRETAAKLGAEEMVVESDPDAVGFYLHMGCVRAGEAASSSIPGRTIPRLTLAID